MANINNNIIWSKGHNGLKLITKNDSNTDEWDPYESELAAAMFNGIEIFPIQKHSKILCLDKNFELTLNHILNIIGNDGRINLISENISKTFGKPPRNLQKTSQKPLKRIQHSVKHLSKTLQGPSKSHLKTSPKMF